MGGEGYFGMLCNPEIPPPPYPPFPHRINTECTRPVGVEMRRVGREVGVGVGVVWT